MNYKIFVGIILFVNMAFQGFAQTTRHESLFDGGWKFYRGDVAGAEQPSFDDKSWRDIDLPHDWSIENLPGQKPGEVVGPFSKESIGTTATGYTVGGTGWYRKTFTLPASDKFAQTIINFDGVYMNSEVWVNGKLLGSHPYGYTAFHYDITKFLNPAGQPNVIAVKVKNEGQNSRWYSGSGIYRHVWLIQEQAVCIAHNGVFITTENISPDKAEIKLSALVENHTGTTKNVKLVISAINSGGKTVSTIETDKVTISPGSREITQQFAVLKARLWSIEEPNLYIAKIQVLTDGAETDEVSETFGIRTIHFDAKNGFQLNGKTVLLKGGCMHQDNGFLGTATIDRAEERRVELMKANGFNAIRTSHNPPSAQFLDACDRIGVLVLDEAFDQWERAKNPEDYHLYFKDWWKKDLESMVLRDRNHPSLILWSIGNELNERADSLGYAIRKMLVPYVHELDPTRPVTEAICSFWDHWGQDWSTTIPAYADLDVGGYNYMNNQYEKDHEQFPERMMIGTESYAGEAYGYWKQVEKNPYVLGDFVWTAMDYLGETGCGSSVYSEKQGPRVGLKPWPWFNAFCGDIDICGFKKPQSYYRDVVWDNSKIEMMVHAPIPEGMKETVSYWGWPDELPSWNWAGNEGATMEVRVFSKYPLIRLELNDKVIGEQPAGDQTNLIATFKVPYASGILKATAIENGKEVASKILQTTGNPAKIKLTADRSAIKADRNDLSYVTIEITDAQGNIVPDANIPVIFMVSGVGEIAGSGNGSPTDMESFNNPVCKTFHGKALAILRPSMGKKEGTITLKVESDGLETGEINIKVKKNFKK